MHEVISGRTNKGEGGSQGGEVHKRNGEISLDEVLNLEITRFKQMRYNKK